MDTANVGHDSEPRPPLYWSSWHGLLSPRPSVGEEYSPRPEDARGHWWDGGLGLHLGAAAAERHTDGHGGDEQAFFFLFFFFRRCCVVVVMEDGGRSNRGEISTLSALLYHGR